MKKSARPTLASIIWLACVLVAGGAIAPRPTRANDLRFIATVPGGIVATGNTLGLSKELDANGPGTEDSIGTFISLDPGSIDDSPPNPLNPWPSATTSAWTANGSAATLTLPVDSTVLYAELVWGGSFDYFPEDVTGSLGSAVTLSAGGADISVGPDPATALTISEVAFGGYTANYYLRTADVTSFVSTHGGASYSVEGVPATQSEMQNAFNAAGWTLVVAYRDASRTTRHLAIFVGGSFVDDDSEEDYVVAGSFCSPPSGPFEGGVVVSALEGDADLNGDVLGLAESMAGPFPSLSGPNNPAANFFASQINGEDGSLDSSGTFGDQNHDASMSANVSGARQGWDLTRIPLSSEAGQLASAQTSAVFRASTTGDAFIPAALGFEVEVDAPYFHGLATSADVDVMSVSPGDTLTLTVGIDNQGPADAAGLVFTAPLPAGVALMSFSIDGVPGDALGGSVTTADLTNGVDIGDIGAGSAIEIIATLEVASGTPGVPIVIIPGWDYQYLSCGTGSPLGESYELPAMAISFTTPLSDAGPDAGAPGPSSSSGCGCSVPGSGGDAPPLAALLLLLAFWRLSRRRRDALSYRSR